MEEPIKIDLGAAQQDLVQGVSAPAEDNTIKVNLDQPPKKEEDVEQVSDEQQEQPVEQVESAPEGTEEAIPPVELVSEEKPQEENLDNVIELVGQEDVKSEPVAIHEIAATEPEAAPKIELPDNIQKLVDFVNETGGTVEDYVSLNKDYSELNDVDVVREYYKQKYPHYSEDRLTRRIDKDFLFDKDMDDADVIQDKKDAFEDAVHDARSFLEDKKTKYYDDLKFNRTNNIPEEYKQAFDIAQNYNEVQKTSQQLQEKFTQATEQVFSQDFKGFDFKVGDNTYRYKVADPQKTKTYQSDINNFVKEFLGDDGSISDAGGYHKAMYAAKNVDKIAQHFYEQGRAEALKQQAKEAKNISMDPRKDFSANVVTKGGTKVRVVDSGFDGKLRFKTKK